MNKKSLQNEYIVFSALPSLGCYHFLNTFSPKHTLPLEVALKNCSFTFIAVFVINT